MSEPDLFAAMDELADAGRRSELHVLEDDQIAFIHLTRERRPDLSREQRDQLFPKWQKHYYAKQRAELARGRMELLMRDAERQALLRDLPPAEPFRCPCGELIYSWSKEAERLHAEHVMIAGLDRQTGKQVT
jgi:hypothetical protein